MRFTKALRAKLSTNKQKFCKQNKNCHFFIYLFGIHPLLRYNREKSGIRGETEFEAFKWLNFKLT